MTSPGIATRYVNGIVSYYETLNARPLYAAQGNDARPGWHISRHKERTVIAFDVDKQRVSVMGTRHAAQDHETTLQDDPDDEN